MKEMQEYINALQDAAIVLSPEDDFMTLLTAEDRMRQAAYKSEIELNEAQGKLRELARLLDAARASSTRPSTVPSEEAHVQTLNNIDAAKLNLAKLINDAEDFVASKEAELSRLKKERGELDCSDPSSSHDLDGSTLRLSILRGLGFEPISERSGSVKKVIVGSQKGELHTVLAEEGENEFKRTQLLWQLAS